MLSSMMRGLAPCNGRRYRVASVLALCFVLVSLPGCNAYISVLERGENPIPAPAATVMPRDHAVAILGVDFDPPLDYAALAATGSVTLLAAIENQGLSDETNLRVSARLIDPTQAAGQNELLNETVVIGSLRAGEIRTVRFSEVSQLPARLDRYQLAVELQPVPGEVYTADNFRSYDIVLNSGE